MTDKAIDLYKPAMTLMAAVERRNAIIEFSKVAMRSGIDYGVVPGTGQKPTLLKPGAEKICTLFGLANKFTLLDKVEDWTGEQHGGEPLFHYRYSCELYRDSQLMGSGEGSCNSWEKKYRYRQAERLCPECGKPTIIKGKTEYGGGWICFAKKGGCGKKFKDGYTVIESQQAGQTKNQDVSDLVNTILKMSQKRALVAATLITVNASEFYTQDMEDIAMIEGDWSVAETTGHPLVEQEMNQTPTEAHVEVKQNPPVVGPIFIEGVLEYRVSKGVKEVNCNGTWVEAEKQIGKLTQASTEKILALFSGPIEMQNHLKKHFQGVIDPTTLTWEELTAMFSWKKDGKADPRWYGDKVSETKAVDLMERLAACGLIGGPSGNGLVQIWIDKYTLPTPVSTDPNLAPILEKITESIEKGIFDPKKPDDAKLLTEDFEKEWTKLNQA